MEERPCFSDDVGSTGNRSVIAGVGNTMMRDEGAGINVVQRMELYGFVPAGYTIEKVGASSFNIVHAISSTEVAVVVDCAYMKETPGTIRMFTPDQVESKKFSGGLSLHDGDLLQSIDLLRRIGEVPRHIYIFGIEPHTVEYGEGLSTILERNLFHYVAYICKCLETIGEMTRPVNA